MKYSVVTRNANDDGALPLVPSSIWVLSTLEIVLKYREKTFLLLIFPSYALSGEPGTPSHDEGYWAPPFVAYPVPLTFSPPSSVGSIRRVIRDELTKIDVNRDLQHLCYQMGLRDVNLEPREAFLELKVSPRSPTLVKGYYILRHGLVAVAPSSLRNLADPEVRRGYVYLPLDDQQVAHADFRYSESHQRKERWFLGKPVQSNIQVLLENAEQKSAISAKSFEIGATSYVRSETGIIWVVDLKGYGSALKHIGKTMHTFRETASDAQDYFRQDVVEQFQRMLGELGSSQVQIAGDGFIAAFPNRVFGAVAQAISLIVSRWTKFIGYVESLNYSIDEIEYKVGSRMILHYGDYRFGRIGGPRSFAPAFDGMSIIEAARLEQGLGVAIKGNLIEPNMPSHFLALSDNLKKISGIKRLSPAWKSLGAKALSAKEYHGESWLYYLLKKGLV